MRIRQHAGNVDINITDARLLRNLKEAQKLLNMQVAADCDPLIPFQQGALRNSVNYPQGIYGGEIEYNYDSRAYINCSSNRHDDNKNSIKNNIYYHSHSLFLPEQSFLRLILTAVRLSITLLMHIICMREKYMDPIFQ